MCSETKERPISSQTGKPGEEAEAVAGSGIPVLISLAQRKPPDCFTKLAMGQPGDPCFSSNRSLDSAENLGNYSTEMRKFCILKSGRDDLSLENTMGNAFQLPFKTSTQ